MKACMWGLLNVTLFKGICGCYAPGLVNLEGRVESFTDEEK